MSDFFKINQIMFPLDCVRIAYQHMQKVGLQHLEGVALFAGREEGDETFIVEKTIIPKQRAYNEDYGLLYTIGGDELHRINVSLYNNKMTLIAQIHSHPGRAYHSETDDAYPVISTSGGISIVVPNFAYGQIAIDTWAVYRLSVDNTWIGLTKKEKKSLIIII